MWLSKPYPILMLLCSQGEWGRAKFFARPEHIIFDDVCEGRNSMILSRAPIIKSRLPPPAMQRLVLLHMRQLEKN